MAKPKEKEPALNYNSGGLPRLSSMSKAEQRGVLKWARSIIEQYVIVREKNPMLLNDISLLPCAKQGLKDAIKILLLSYISNQSLDEIDELKKHYISISSFQKLDTEDSKLLANLANDEDVRSEKSINILFTIFHKYLDLYQAEQQALATEINAYVQDVKQL